MVAHANRKPGSRVWLVRASAALAIAVVLLQAGAAFIGNGKSLPQRLPSRSLGTGSPLRPAGRLLPSDDVATWWARGAAAAALCCAAAARMLSRAPRHAGVARMAAFRVMECPVAPVSPEFSPTASPSQTIGLEARNGSATPGAHMQKRSMPSVHVQQHPMPSAQVPQPLTCGDVCGRSTLDEASFSGQRATRPQAASFLAGSRRSRRWRSSRRRAARVAAQASQRHVGGKLHRPAIDYPPVRLSFDPSILRIRIQRGLWIPHQGRSKLGSDSKVQSGVLGVDIMGSLGSRCNSKVETLSDKYCQSH